MPLAERFDALAAGFMATEQVPGAIAAVIDGTSVILRGWGLGLATLIYPVWRRLVATKKH